MWKSLQLFFKPNSRSPCYISYQNTNYESAESIAKLFNSYFAAVIPKSLCEVYGFIPFSSDISSVLTMPSHCNASFSIKHASTLDVIHCFFSFKKSRVDDKFISHYFADVICSYVNYCFDTNCFPDFLKTAEIIPIFKKGSVNKVGNYRRISLLPTLSKLIEKLVFLKFLIISRNINFYQNINLAFNVTTQLKQLFFIFYLLSITIWVRISQLLLYF